MVLRSKRQQHQKETRAEGRSNNRMKMWERKAKYNDSMVTAQRQTGIEWPKHFYQEDMKEGKRGNRDEKTTKSNKGKRRKARKKENTKVIKEWKGRCKS